VKKVVVIGSNSFSGSDFVDLLLEKGGYTVAGVSRSSEKSSLFLPYKRHQGKNFRFFQADLNHHFRELCRFLSEFQPDYIVNFAAQSEVAPSWAHPEHWFQTNAVALTRLANFLKDLQCLKRYVHISSPEVYGTCEGVVTESAPLNPSTPYAASKAAGDLSLFTFYKNFGLPLVMIRATNVYGAHQQLFKIIPRSLIRLHTKEVIELHGGGKAVKSYIHIRDVSEGELLAMEKGRIGEIYHLSPDQGVAVRDVVERLCQVLRADFSRATREVEERLGQDKAYIIDSTKARKELGWMPKISIEEGLSQTARWVETRLEEILQQPLQYIHKE